MFVGHFAVGLTGKKVAPRVSLGTWFMAVQLLDLLWPIFLLLGWEHVRIVPGLMKLNALDLYDYPLSHSLVGALVVGPLRHGLQVLGRVESALRAGGATPSCSVRRFSHWLLDVLVHRPDVPLLPHGPYIGLGLWDQPAVELLLEGGLYALGIYLYLRATRARDRIGSWGLYLLLAFLLATWLSAAFGPPPPDERTLAWVP